MMDDDEDQSLVDYLVLELPGGTMSVAGLALLTDLLGGGDGRVLDLVFIRKQPGEPADVVDTPYLGDGVDLELIVPAGTPSGLIGPSEVAAAGDHIDAGSLAAILMLDTAPARRDVRLPRQRAPQAPALGERLLRSP
jgi:hypothetical protein